MRLSLVSSRRPPNPGGVRGFTRSHDQASDDATGRNPAPERARARDGGGTEGSRRTPEMGYKDVDIPSGKEPSEYTYHERRSELLGLAIEAGHPDMISRKHMGERYDVEPSTITRDIQALGDEIHDDLSTDAELITAVIYRKAIREKMDQGDYMEAVQMAESWNEWLEDRGEQEKVPDRMEMDLDASVESTERKALIGVDLGAFQGVNTEQMVGLDVDEEMMEAESDLPDGVEVPLGEDEDDD